MENPFWEKLRQTEARLEAREAEQAARAAEPKLRALEKLANGIARATEIQEMSALKQRIGKIDRAARGYLEYADDDARTAILEAAELSQRNERRNREAIEAPKQADREVRWRAKRAEIYRERARLKRKAEEEGTGYLEPPHLPTNAPVFFEAEPDGVRVRTYQPSIPQPIRNADGTTSLSFDRDVITGRAPGPELLTAEQQFQRKAEAER